jgi:ATP-binding cassette subfamily B protein RaxB
VFEARQASHFLESLRGVQAIKLFNAQADRQSRFASLVVDTMNAEISHAQAGAVFGRGAPAAVRPGARGRGLGRGAAGAGQPLTVGMLFAFFAYKEQFASV